MLAHWNGSYAGNSDIVAREGVDHLQRLMGVFVDESLAYSSPPYRIVAPLPDRLQTTFGSEEQGLKAGFQARHADAAAFAPTRTTSSTWDAQRLGGAGRAVWYRHNFRLPPAARGKPIGLFLGGFDDQAKVWINGRLAGASDVDFSSPALFDLTPRGASRRRQCAGHPHPARRRDQRDRGRRAAAPKLPLRRHRNR